MAYCYCKIKRTSKMQCRFYFLRPLQPLPTVFNILNPKWLSYCPNCNDVLMGNYNTNFSLGWLANVDISPCTNQNAVLGYVAKYYSKTKFTFLSFKDFLKEMLKMVNPKSFMLLLATKILNKVISKQDWSA